ncbi:MULTISPECIES: hypothetical protein [Mycolicibacterium]|uniref:hypothetical protein n=1 Tax=Mycolicibacterium TaxID=1866885 RepID=UPI001F2F610E|nr:MULTISPECIES: hypothetical protein [Mycolicibacterium]
MTSTDAQPTCVLPGCSNPVHQQGRPCQECVVAFGDYLLAGEGPGLTAEQQAARDRETMRGYAMHKPNIETAPEAIPPPRVRAKQEPERKQNQTCWMCEQRRTCTKQEHGWECDECLTIT